MTTYKMKSSEAIKTSLLLRSTCKMSEATKRRTRCLRLTKRKMEGSCSRKEMCRTAVTSSRHKMARYIGETETDCDLPNLKKH